MGRGSGRVEALGTLCESSRRGVQYASCLGCQPWSTVPSSTVAACCCLAYALARIVNPAYLHCRPPQIAMGVADEKLQPAVPGHLPADLVAIATWCCDFDPAMRPTFADIALELDKVVQQLQVRWALGQVYWFRACDCMRGHVELLVVVVVDALPRGLLPSGVDVAFERGGSASY